MKIAELQKLMKDIYYHCDRERGIHQTFVWLVSEIGELANSIRKEDDLKEIEEEFADILAWTASLANLLNIDLERAITDKYPGKCPRCNSCPCKCSF
ncbi:MAG: MazG nucleotide pyrophosphohydrolase domain-containing protein [Candidatus Heimdallarchaeota archaeon]